MPASRSTTPLPRGVLRHLRREALSQAHLTDDQFRQAQLAQGHPADAIERALARRTEVMRRGFLDREPGAAHFERRAHARAHGIGEGAA